MPKKKLHHKMLESAGTNAALSAVGSTGVNAALLASGVGAPLIIPSAALAALGGGAIGATQAYLQHHKDKKEKVKKAFVKRAMEYGFDEHESEAIFQQSNYN